MTRAEEYRLSQYQQQGALREDKSIDLVRKSADRSYRSTESDFFGVVSGVFVFKRTYESVSSGHL